ncbi:MAG: AI-2E family transporter [Candidatus Binataceae bacterium]|jgi:predicted PurR-regulated permease PerM
MKEPETEFSGLDEREEEFELHRITRPLLAIIITTAVLYLGRQVLLPMAMASILAIIFSPVANRLEPLLGRFLSAALVLIVSLTAVGGLIYFLTVELTAVAVDVAGYSNNIAAKVNELKQGTPQWFQRVENGVAAVEQQIQTKSTPLGPRKATVVQTAPASPDVTDVLKPMVPVLSSLADALLITVLLFFLLYGRSDLRDRFVRLAVRARITIAAQAIETAAGAVGRYLLLFSLTNLSFGVAIGFVVWLMGMPNPVFWGGLAFLLRFIPYVGVLISAILPTLVAFAVFPGWHKSFEVLGAFILLDQVSAQLAEPFLIGRGIGLSPVALLISAMYWSWLWGVAGLLLATPLTACLKVAGDYIPSLGFLSILLGAGSASEDYHEYYRRLLELDQSSARGLAIRYCDENGLEAAFDHIIRPALVLMGKERSEDHISAENEQFMTDATMEIVVALGNRLSRPNIAARVRVLGLTPAGETHSMGLLFLLELLRQDGAAAIFASDSKSMEEVRGFLRRFGPNVVCLSCTMPECLPAAVELIRSLKAEAPRLRIYAGGDAALAHAGDLLAAGCSQICAGRGEARRSIRRYAIQRRFRSGETSLPMPIEGMPALAAEGGSAGPSSGPAPQS